MSGHLQQSPFVKTYDELTRSRKRMESYLNINSQLLSNEQKEAICGMVENIQKAINHIPEEFQIQRYERK